MIYYFIFDQDCLSSIDNCCVYEHNGLSFHTCRCITLGYMPDIILLDDSENVTVGQKEERMMMTGMHTVVDIFCVGCGSIVGWKYVR